VKNSTHNFVYTTSNKSLVENFLELNHNTLPKLNTEDFNGRHSTDVAQRMIKKTNTTRVVPKRAKEFDFTTYFQYAPLQC